MLSLGRQFRIELNSIEHLLCVLSIVWWCVWDGVGGWGASSTHMSELVLEPFFFPRKSPYSCVPETLEVSVMIFLSFSYKCSFYVGGLRLYPYFMLGFVSSVPDLILFVPHSNACIFASA